MRDSGVSAGSSLAIVLCFAFPGYCRPFLSYQRMYYVFIQMLSSGPAWLAIVLLVTVSLLPDVLKKVLCRQLWPSATERVQVPGGRGAAALGAWARAGGVAGHGAGAQLGALRGVGREAAGKVVRPVLLANSTVTRDFTPELNVQCLDLIS